MLPVFLWSCEPPANAGDGLADELPERLEQVEDAQYAERVKADDAAALPAARTHEIHGERDNRKRRHADVEARPGIRFGPCRGGTTNRSAAARGNFRRGRTC